MQDSKRTTASRYITWPTACSQRMPGLPISVPIGLRFTAAKRIGSRIIYIYNIQVIYILYVLVHIYIYIYITISINVRFSVIAGSFAQRARGTKLGLGVG